MAGKSSLTNVSFEDAREHSYLGRNLKRALSSPDPNVIEVLDDLSTTDNNIDDCAAPMRSVERLEASTKDHYFTIIEFDHNIFLI